MHFRKWSSKSGGKLEPVVGGRRLGQGGGWFIKVSIWRVTTALMELGSRLELPEKAGEAEIREQVGQ